MADAQAGQAFRYSPGIETFDPKLSEYMTEILTMVIWTAGPQHAAVNFTQQEHLGYLPANPIAGFTEEPRGRDHQLNDWLANLPPARGAGHDLGRASLS